MPTAEANGITINYDLSSPSAPSSSSSESPETIVLINGLADDLTTWDYQVPAFLSAGYRVLRYDNRGIGLSSRPSGMHTAELMARDLHALLEVVGVRKFHLLGVSMGGMIAQSYALLFPNKSNGKGEDGEGMLSLSLCCTYAAPTPFCSRMFALWADMAQRMSVQDVMRDVTIWAFTVPFFREREAELEEFEQAMNGLDMGVEAYLGQLNVIQMFDSRGELEGLKGEGKVLGGLREGEVMVLAGEEDILIPVVLSRELAGGIRGAVFETARGGHACLWEFPDEFNKVVLEFLAKHRRNKQ